MLELKPNCENCGRLLPNESDEAMICSFECTYCLECVHHVLFNVCPNCGGGFEKRPSRPKKLLEKYPTSKTEIIRPIDSLKFNSTLDLYLKTDPRKR